MTEEYKPTSEEIKKANAQKIEEGKEETLETKRKREMEIIHQALSEKPPILHKGETIENFLRNATPEFFIKIAEAIKGVTYIMSSVGYEYADERKEREVARLEVGLWSKPGHYEAVEVTQTASQHDLLKQKEWMLKGLVQFSKEYNSAADCYRKIEKILKELGGVFVMGEGGHTTLVHRIDTSIPKEERTSKIANSYTGYSR